MERVVDRYIAFAVDVSDALHMCSKDDGARLIRKMIIDGILVEETHRQDNQYASLVAKLKLNPQLAARVESGALKLTLAFAAKPAADSKKAKKAPEKERQVHCNNTSFVLSCLGKDFQWLSISYMAADQ